MSIAPVRVSSALLVLAVSLTILPSGGTPAKAQGPDAEWRTIELPHHRVHYPAPAEEWARHVAARLESIHEIVAGLVGWTPEAKVDVILQDPIGLANGSAWALPGRPRMVLWATPPPAGSQLGFFRDWSEILAGHEQVHLTHLLRPPRNRWGRWLSALVPAAPIARKSPRWVVEGYATLLEGRISGRGRPHAHLRAAVLREWARAGRLPSYARLASDREGWLGMSMAYLVGSSYLEWLEQRAGPDALPHLWRRLTAREGRSFEEAFRGVFGDDPAALYDRFRAELSHRALTLEQDLAELRREGDTWQDFGWGTGPPAVSPDGERIAVVRTDREDPPRLVVLATGPDEEAERKRRERIEAVLAADPEDVAPVETGPLPREPLAELPLEDSGAGAVPRWLPDGSILFTQTLPDAEGFLRWDLFRWHPESGEVERLTTGADLRLADPSPDGSWVAALRVRWGLTEIVRLDLGNGEVSTLVPGAIGTILDAPRLSPNGERLAYLRHADGDWRLRIRHLATKADHLVPTPGSTTLAHPAWRRDGRHLYLAVGEDGLLDVQAFGAVPDAEDHRVTRSLAAAYAPEPTPDGKHLFYLSLDADGVDLRRLALDAATLQDVEIALDPSLAPVVPPSPGEPIRIERSEVPADRPYGVGEAEIDWFPVLAIGPSGRTGGLGLRAGDVLGRWNALGAAELSDRGGVSGGTIAAAWDGWPVDVGLQVFRSEERYGEQPETVPFTGGPANLDEEGVVADLGWLRFHRRGLFDLGLAAGRTEIAKPHGGSKVGRTTAGLTFGWTGTWRGRSWTLTLAPGVEAQVGTTDETDWERFAGELRITLERGDTRLVADGAHHFLEGEATDLDLLRLGGSPSTIRPALVDAHRLLDPALPAGAAAGDRAQRLGVRVDSEALPLSPFWRRYRVWSDGGSKDDWLDLAGLELVLDTEPVPLLGLPGAELRVGAAYLFDEPLADEVTGWVVLVWRP